MKLTECNILIVEDEMVATEYLKEILSSLRISSIYEAKNSQEALAIVENNQIDFAFMDINIHGGMDGIACANMLNTIYSVAIIFTTAYADRTTLNEAKDTNIFGYIVKPFLPNDIEIALLVAISQLERNSVVEVLSSPSKILELGEGYSYNTQTKTLTHLNIPIKLTKKELEILAFFCANPNQNISYETIKEGIWRGKEVTLSCVRDTVFRLKKKTPDLHIENISNYGYMLKTKHPFN